MHPRRGLCGRVREVCCGRCRVVCGSCVGVGDPVARCVTFRSEAEHEEDRDVRHRQEREQVVVAVAVAVAVAGTTHTQHRSPPVTRTKEPVRSTKPRSVNIT